MTVEYMILGAVLLVMGAVQIWLRHLSGSLDAKEGRAGGSAEEEPAKREVPVAPGGGRIRRGRAWDYWTAMLGFIGVFFGITLIVLGALGR